MTSAERRNQISEILAQTDEPVSATSLANRFAVSRQVIVGDIALLRAAGIDIQATPRGYVIMRRDFSGYAGTIACRHDRNGLRDELYTIIDNGGGVLDVIVDHPIYGQLVGQLHLFSRHDIDDFMHRLETAQGHPLSQVTDGVHLHTIRCQDEAAFARIVAALDQIGVLYHP